MPESCRICGLPTAPAARMVSTRASAYRRSLPRRYATPVTRLPSMRSHCTVASVRTSRFGRFIAGRRKAFAADTRTPRRWLTSKRPLPSLSPRLKSSVGGMPHSSAAAWNASRISHESRCCSTRHSPPAPCQTDAPRQWSSDLRNTGSTLSQPHDGSPVSLAHSS